MSVTDYSATFALEAARDNSDLPSAWSVLSAWQRGLFAILGISIIFSALSVVYVHHIHRQQLRQIHLHINWQDRMNHQWAQLQAEQGSLASLARVEEHARHSLGMVVPDLSQVTFMEVESGTKRWQVAKHLNTKPGEHPASGFAQLAPQQGVFAPGQGRVLPHDRMLRTGQPALAPES